MNELNVKNGVMYKGVFYEFNSLEYKNLILIEGKLPENEGTLLGIFSNIERENLDELLNVKN